jgi:hypothetical protein
MCHSPNLQTVARRVRVARIIHEHGPTQGFALAAALDMTQDQLWMHVLCDWFEVTALGWRLTPQGLREALKGTVLLTASV